MSAAGKRTRTTPSPGRSCSPTGTDWLGHMALAKRMAAVNPTRMRIAEAWT
jgi:hypothetical protein